MKAAKLPRLTEKQFQDQVVKLARLHGWAVAHFRPARTAKGWRTPCQYDAAGFPDLVLVRRGNRILFRELKVGGRGLTAEQAEWLERLLDAGQDAALWDEDSWPEIEEQLK